MAHFRHGVWQDVRQKELEVVEDEVFPESAPIKPSALDVVALLEDNVVEENVPGDAHEGAIGDVIVPQVAHPAAGQLLQLGALDVAQSETGDVDVVQTVEPHFLRWQVGRHLGHPDGGLGRGQVRPSGAEAGVDTPGHLIGLDRPLAHDGGRSAARTRPPRPHVSHDAGALHRQLWRAGTVLGFDVG